MQINLTASHYNRIKEEAQCWVGKPAGGERHAQVASPQWYSTPRNACFRQALAVCITAVPRHHKAGQSVLLTHCSQRSLDPALGSLEPGDVPQKQAKRDSGPFVG